MTTLNETIITDMGILSNEVYNNEKYFTFKQSGQREYNEIVTFNGTYTIIDSTDNPNDPNTIHSSTGLDALLLRAPDGQYVIAFRGTQEGVDILVDFSIFLTSLATGTGIAWNAQRSDAEAFVTKMMNDYNISSSNLTLTGHSLGGILAQTIASTKNLEAYTFNALGTTGLTRFENPNGTNILNLSYTDDGFLNGDPLSNAATFWGNSQVGEVLPMIGDDLGFGAHGMDYMNAVIATYNFILESFISETTYRDVTQAYLENSRLDGFFGDTYEKTNQYLFTDVNISTGSSLSFNFLNDLTASQIEQQAKSDRAVLFAILKLNGFAVDGNLTAYSNMDLAHYSEVYIAQRSLFLYALLDPNNAKLADTHFSDRDMGISLRSNDDNMNNILFGSESVSVSYRELLIGGSKNDYLFGMNGDDVLVGNTGDDYLEGGAGFDTLQGGVGHDVLLGDNDSDVLYGGEGQDTLIGGDNDNASDALFGGSGEDVLLGGGGDDTLVGGDASNLYADKELDYLAGGVGHDIYYVSHQDIINDADSTGFIMFNDKSLSGTKTKVDEYTYEDANFTYTLNGPNMIVVDKNLGEYITIENMNFNNASGMGMEFDDGSETDPNKKDIEIYVGDATVTEGGTLEFTIGIDNTLDEDLVVNVSSYWSGSANSSDLSGTTNGTITIKAGTTYGDEILINNNLHVDMKEVA